MLDYVADGALILAALFAAAYCHNLSRRIKKLNGFDTGLGGAIAVLSSQVDGLKKAVAQAEASAHAASSGLQDTIKEAEDLAERLDVMIASMHDVAQPAATFSEPPIPLRQRVNSNEAFPFSHARRAKIKGLR